MKTNFFQPIKKTKKGRPEVISSFEKSQETLAERSNHSPTQPETRSRRGEFLIYQKSAPDRSERVELNQFQSLRAEIQTHLSQLETSQIAPGEVFESKKNTIMSQVQKPGIYHINFFARIRSGLAKLRTKTGESKSWMKAMQEVKAKRGSLFAARSKRQGTQYSQSQEISSARSVM